MVGLVADIFPVTVHREFHTQLAQVHEAPDRQSRLAQRVVAVHTSSCKQIGSHFSHAVGAVAAETELIVCLLVAAGIARRSAVNPLGNNRAGKPAVLLYPARGIVARSTGTDDNYVIFKYLHNKPSVTGALCDIRRQHRPTDR